MHIDNVTGKVETAGKSDRFHNKPVNLSELTISIVIAISSYVNAKW